MAGRYGLPTPLPPADALPRVRETLEVWQGARGDGLDRVVTVRDLLNAGIATDEAAATIYETAGLSVPDSIPTVAPSPAVPPAPDALVVSGTVQVAVLDWAFPEDYARLVNFEVWRSATTLLADAVLVGTPVLTTFTDDIGSAGSFYYWVRAVSDGGVSPFNSNDGTPVTTTTAVTSVSVATANGFGGTVATPTTTPVITLTTDLTGLLKGDGTAMSTAVAGTDYVAPGGALGTPSSGTLTNCTGLPVAGIAGLAAGVGTFLGTPSSANLQAALTDETGSGSAVFGTAPDLTNTKLLGTTYIQQPAQTTKAAAATLTIAELLTGIIQYTGAAANLTLPTGANIDAGVLSGLAADRAFEFTVINTGTGTATLVTAAGLTLVGSMAVASATSARFRVRKTAASTFTVYRV